MLKVSVVLPCLNEEEGLEWAIPTIKNVFKTTGLQGEIIVVDNDSTDNSAAVAKQHGVVYVFQKERGYGNTYRAGLPQAKGEHIIMADPDGSYDFNEIPNFLSNLEHYDVVLGSRFSGQMKAGAMPILHRYIGNPGIRFLLWSLHGVRVSEPSTGFVGLRKDALSRLKLKEAGMEFSSEMLVEIGRQKLKLKEIPITYHQRIGLSKLRTWQDGMRHLRYLIKAKLQGPSTNSAK